MNLEQPPQQPTAPTPEEVQDRIAFADRFSRIQINNALNWSKEPARVAEHNRLASRVLTPKGMQAMQQVNPADLIVGMLTGLLNLNMAILNELIIARGGTPELREVKPQAPPIQPSNDNGKDTAHGL